MPYPNLIDPAQIGPRALAVVEERGWDRWSLRDVAADLHVSPNALYRHVDGREGLVVAIGECAAWALHGAIAEVGGDGEDHLTGVADVYVRFALARPHAFAALLQGKPAPGDPRIEPWAAVWDHLRRQFERAVPQSPGAACFAYWALIHGRAELAGGPARLDEPTAGLGDAVHALIAGYRSMGPVADPVPPWLER
ncbi:TetR/AcrR family transcriptional regulator [Actinotalea subterranea]|uniref:TetR/AcrR family transcriptional regulator n=1 Tax=Actinotalea subterranea TaxID=2607497 RepID=UPI00165D3F49|nr:TetR/AcrR family transcriptional regulator [Actinotalea subterranea]